MTVTRILLAHNFYLDAARSGEDTVYEGECRLLQQAGFELTRFERRNEDVAAASAGRMLKLAATAGWSHDAYRDMARMLRARRPQVAHFHNVFPLITPAAFAACRDAGVAVVQTLHNFRWRCVSGLLLRAGKPCEFCWGGNPLHGVLHGCYQSSPLRSVAAAGAQLLNRRLEHRQHLVDRYIALTEFSRRKHIDGGLPGERIAVKGNCMADAPLPGGGDGGHFFFAGRLGVEKGVRTLVRAWIELGPSAPLLRIAGQGPLTEELRALLAGAQTNVELLGVLPRAQVIAQMQSAAAVVVPSECYEGFPLVIAEALAAGTPVIAARTGGLPEMIEPGVTGALFTPADVGSLVATVRALTADGRLAHMRLAARRSYDNRFSAARTVESLRSIYQEAATAASSA